jgi:hypothetical protein
VQLKNGSPKKSTSILLTTIENSKKKLFELDNIAAVFFDEFVNTIV